LCDFCSLASRRHIFFVKNKLNLFIGGRFVIFQELRQYFAFHRSTRKERRQQIIMCESKLFLSLYISILRNMMRQSLCYRAHQMLVITFSSSSFELLRTMYYVCSLQIFSINCETKGHFSSSNHFSRRFFTCMKMNFSKIEQLVVCLFFWEFQDLSVKNIQSKLSNKCVTTDFC
jgi:hypothetical protein